MPLPKKQTATSPRKRVAAAARRQVTQGAPSRAPAKMRRENPTLDEKRRVHALSVAMEHCRDHWTTSELLIAEAREYEAYFSGAPRPATSKKRS